MRGTSEDAYAIVGTSRKYSNY
jgi:hypothetical protein